MILFTEGLQPHLPLGEALKTLKINVSFIMGENDWMRVVEDDYGERVVESQLKEADRQEKAHYLICPGAGHQIQ